MKRVVSTILLGLFSVVFTASPAQTGSEASATGYVYICTGPNAKVYHTTPNCKGLNKCSGSIKKVSRNSTNRRPCRLCAR